MTSLIDVFAASAPLFIAVAVILGLLVGSFLNVVIYRLPIMMEQSEQHYCSVLLNQTTEEAKPVFNLWKPRSRCPECDHMITARENIPLLSYLLQGGRCSHCKTRISIQYPIVEAISGILTGVVAWHFGFGLQAGAAILLTWALLALSVIDLKHQLLPDSITPSFFMARIIMCFVGGFYRFKKQCNRRDGGVSGAVVSFSAFPYFNGKRRYGLWRLQVTRITRRLARLAKFDDYYYSCITRRISGWYCFDTNSRSGSQFTHPIWTVSGNGWLDSIVMGRATYWMV